jgi:hypothetical protein
MPAVGAGAGATYAASGGDGARATGGGGGATTGAGGWLWLHAATSAKADAIMTGLANLTITLSLSGTALIRIARTFAQPSATASSVIEVYQDQCATRPEFRWK